MDDRRSRQASHRIGRRQHTSNHIPGRGGRIGGGTLVQHYGGFAAMAQTMPRNLTQTDTLSPQRSRALRRGKAVSGKGDLWMTTRPRAYGMIMRGLIAAGLLAGPILGPARAQSAAQPQSTAAPMAPSAVKVEGNQRIEADSIRSYFHAENGQPLAA